MIINKSVESGVIVLLMLGLQKDHVPVRSSTLSMVLDSSDSYLKKTLRKLVVAGLVKSAPGRDGGFTLTRPLDTITLADAIVAIDRDALSFHRSELARSVFPDSEAVDRCQKIFAEAITRSCDAFLETAQTYPLTAFLSDDTWQSGSIDWRTVCSSRTASPEETPN